MKKLIDDVRAFHKLCGHGAEPTVPTIPESDKVFLRDRLLAEEYYEYEDASARGDIVELADALADMMYIIIGTALEYGIPLDKVWDEVQRTNMAKAGPNGKVRKRHDGKILKPMGWTPPDIAGVLYGK